MSPTLELIVSGPRRLEPPLRICIDANVWISYLGAMNAGKRGTPADLVDIIEDGSAGDIQLQLVLSFELIDTISRVLMRDGLDAASVRIFVAYIEGLMRLGPEALEPSLLVSGRDQFAMHDREDAGVLAACIAHRVELLVTDNLADFEIDDAERHDTQVIRRRNGSTRQLFALIYHRTDRVPIVILHPIDALVWLKKGERPTPDDVRAFYATRHPTP